MASDNKLSYHVEWCRYFSVDVSPKIAVAWPSQLAGCFRELNSNTMSVVGTFRTCRETHYFVASLIGRLGSSTFRLSTTAVSMSLPGSCFSSELAPRPFHHGIRGRGGTIYGRPCRQTAGPSDRANSPHPSSREGHHSTARWSSSFLLSHLILHGCHAAAAACSRVQRNSVPSTQMRCMITARRRASATIAFFIPRRLAICIAQALSHDHFLERIMA